MAYYYKSNMALQKDLDALRNSILGWTLYDSTGGTECNSTSGRAIPWDAQILQTVNSEVFGGVLHQKRKNRERWPERIYCYKRGLYAVTYSAAWQNQDAADDKQIRAWLRTDGAAEVTPSRTVAYCPAGAAYYGQHSARTVVNLRAGNYLELMLKQDGGGPGSALAAANLSWIIVQWIKEV